MSKIIKGHIVMFMDGTSRNIDNEGIWIDRTRPDILKMVEKATSKKVYAVIPYTCDDLAFYFTKTTGVGK